MIPEVKKSTLFEDRPIIYSEMSSLIYAEVVRYVEDNPSLRLEGLAEMVHKEGYSLAKGVRIGVTSTNSPELSNRVRIALRGLNDIIFGELSMAPAFRKGGNSYNPDWDATKSQ